MKEIVFISIALEIYIFSPGCAQERQLLEALFACYGPDHRTICRLLCRPDAHLEVQVGFFQTRNFWHGSRYAIREV